MSSHGVDRFLKCFMTSILIQSANVLDVETLKMLPDTDVWVRDGQIEAVGQRLPVP